MSDQTRMEYNHLDEVELIVEIVSMSNALGFGSVQSFWHEHFVKYYDKMNLCEREEYQEGYLKFIAEKVKNVSNRSA